MNQRFRVDSLSQGKGTHAHHYFHSCFNTNNITFVPSSYQPMRCFQTLCVNRFNLFHDTDNKTTDSINIPNIEHESLEQLRNLLRTRKQE